MNFNDALSRLPLCLSGSFDPHQHKTVEDLKFLAETELRLFREGEIKLGDGDATRIETFLLLFETEPK